MEHVEPNNPKFYEPVALYLSQDCSVSKIRARLRAEHGLQKQDTQIYRAVYQAARAGLLRYVPRQDDGLAMQLQSLSPRGSIRVKVVDDQVPHIAKHAFNLAAAQLLLELTFELAKRVNGRVIRVANAGGPTVANAIDELARQNLDRGALPQIESIALSQIGYSDQFFRTSTYLAVKLAEIYSGTAYVPLVSDVRGEEYSRKIQDTDFFVGGVGVARKGFWSERNGGKLPSTYCGDLFYIPLRQKSGTEKLEPDSSLAREVTRMSLRPKFRELQEALRKGAFVLLLISDDKDCSKASFVRLLIQNRLASHILMSRTLATRILEAIESKRPSAPPAH